MWKYFILRRLNELEVRKDNQIKISKRFAALENLRDSEDINMAWESIKGNIKSSAKNSLYLYELNQHKPWFNEDCSCFEIKEISLKCTGYRIQFKAM